MSTKRIISWRNPYPDCVQLNVQKSFDSTKNFKTVYLARSPELPENGFVDNTFYSGKIYYRIFYVIGGGQYFYTLSKATDAESIPLEQVPTEVYPRALYSTLFVSPNNNSEARPLDIASDPESYSMNKEKLFFNNGLVLPKRKEASLSNTFEPKKSRLTVATPRLSNYVFVNKMEEIVINLPNKPERYEIVFWDDAGKKMFKIFGLTESPVFLDKTNFIRAGLYKFEVMENAELKETNWLLLPKFF